MAAVAMTFDAFAPARPEAAARTDQPAVDEGRWLHCAACRHPIASDAARIVAGGAHEHDFTNPHGLRFHIGCFVEAPGCRPSGVSTEAWTWFPGHAWRVALCRGCRAHLGWVFRPTDQGTSGFYGLILDRLRAHDGGPRQSR